MLTIDAVSPLAQAWHHDCGDPSIHLFSEALQRWQMELPIGARVLELGCCETDFWKRLKAARPDVTLVGADIHPYPGYRDVYLRQPAETLHFEPDTFDAVIALGSLEHFGLGFYGDPVDPQADWRVLQLVPQWLKPHGWLYYDVPWTPAAFYVTENRHFRVYDDAALDGRLTGGLREARRGYAHGSTDVWHEGRPGQPTSPFWYVMRLLVKERGWR